MMNFDKRVYWRKLTALFCVFVLHAWEVKSEVLQCTQKHLLNGLELPELFSDKCILNSEGQNLTKSDCDVWDLGEGEGSYHDCTDLKFTPTAGGLVTGVEFFPYMEPFPNLSISFKKIKWRYMQYRLQVGVSKMCHKLQINKSLMLHDTLQVSFACQTFGWWAAEDSAEVFMDIGHSPSDISKYAHFVMKIPPVGLRQQVYPSNKSLSIKDWYVLVAVDVSHKPDLYVYWPAVPGHYRVTKYNVQINNDDPEEVTCEGDYCSHKMFAGYSSRNVTVSVQPVHEECQRSCHFRSPNINVEFYLPTYFIVMIVSIPILIMMIIICSTYYFCCAAPQEPLQVLLLHDATTEHHGRVVRILTEYLNDVGGVNCMMAHREIPRTESQNPSKWLHKTIDEVDAVIYIASPSTHLDIRFSEYPEVVYEALSLIQKRRSCPAHQRPGHYLVAVPPYCSKENIPKTLLDVPRFYVPEELSWLLWSLYNQQCWVAPFTGMAKVYLKYCWCPGPMSAYPQHGKRLEEALTYANAKQTVDDQLPPTPQGSRRTDWTVINRQDNVSENRSMPYTTFPGNLNTYPLLGQESGSVISEEDVAVRPDVNINTMVL